MRGRAVDGARPRPLSAAATQASPRLRVRLARLQTRRELLLPEGGRRAVARRGRRGPVAGRVCWLSELTRKTKRGERPRGAGPRRWLGSGGHATGAAVIMEQHITSRWQAEGGKKSGRFSPIERGHEATSAHGREPAPDVAASRVAVAHGQCASLTAGAPGLGLQPGYRLGSRACHAAASLLSVPASSRSTGAGVAARCAGFLPTGGPVRPLGRRGGGGGG